MRNVYWFGHEQIQKAVQCGERHLCKLVVPSIRPASETPLLRPKWQPKLRGKAPVVQSEHFQLSYVDHRAPQRPHWHRLQVESYSSACPMIVVALDVDERLRDTVEIAVEFIAAGRVFIPPRFCHLMHLTGLTEVMQLRVAPGSLEQDTHVCENCPTDKCRCGEMHDLMQQAIERHLGAGSSGRK